MPQMKPLSFPGLDLNGSFNYSGLYPSARQFIKLHSNRFFFHSEPFGTLLHCVYVRHE